MAMNISYSTHTRAPIVAPAVNDHSSIRKAAQLVYHNIRYMYCTCSLDRRKARLCLVGSFRLR